jgi:hypothetical protein
MRHHVIIKPEHCINAHYTNVEDCPLARAIKEQKPELGADIGVGGVDIAFYDLGKKHIRFNDEDWDIFIMHRLADGELEKVDIYFDI